MLVLGRNLGEYVMIGDDIKIKVLSVDGHLRMAIEAPKSIPILRGEVYEQQQREKECAKAR